MYNRYLENNCKLRMSVHLTEDGARSQEIYVFDFSELL